MTTQNPNPLDTKLTLYSDPSHGWLEVPFWLLDLFEGLEVTAYSYACKHRQCGYLEEDCDASAFIAAFEAKFGAKPQTGEKYSTKSFIRSLNKYGYVRDKK